MLRTMSISNLLKIALTLLLYCPHIVFGQNCANTKHPGSLNLFKVIYILDGKVKDLDTNFKINIYCQDSLIYVAHSFSMLVESVNPKIQYERFSSLVRIPVLKIDSLSNLSAEIEIGKEKIRWNANEWKHKDSIKFCDSHGLYIYKYSKLRKFPKDTERTYWRFKNVIKAPNKRKFPFVIIGWKLEEIEIEMEVIK